MGRPTWIVSALKKAFPARSQLAKLTRLPVIDRLTDRMLFEDDHLFFLPKEGVARRSISVGKAVEEPESVTLPSEIVARFIEQASTHWLMNSCICREASSCQDYPRDRGCLFLGEAARGINPALGRLVTKEEALEHVQRCREAGLIHMVGRNKLDTVWLGVSPGDRLLTICNCCPCCCLWTMLPQLTPMISVKVFKMPGVTVRVTDRCTGCGVCSEEGVCFAAAIHLNGSRSEISDACRGCGRCVDVCPNGAIEMLIDDTPFVDQVLAQLAPLVDVT